MLVLADDAHLDHDPSSHPGYPEVPRRVTNIREALSAAGLSPEEFYSESADALRGVHPPEMLAYYQEACAAIPAGDTR